jgi:hypothetical protein
MDCTAPASSNARCDQSSVQPVGIGRQHLCCEYCNSAVQQQRRSEFKVWPEFLGGVLSVCRESDEFRHRSCPHLCAAGPCKIINNYIKFGLRHPGANPEDAEVSVKVYFYLWKMCIATLIPGTVSCRL